MKNQEITLLQISNSKTNDSIELEYEFFQNFESIHTRKSYKSDILSFVDFYKSEFKELS